MNEEQLMFIIYIYKYEIILTFFENPNLLNLLIILLKFVI